MATKEGGIRESFQVRFYTDDRGMPASDSTEDKIRFHLKNGHLNEWGFIVVRCTYESDADWDKYISTMKSSIAASFMHNWKIKNSKTTDEEEWDKGCATRAEEEVETLTAFKSETDDLLSTLRIDTIEDRQTLSNASWKAARDAFDKHVLESVNGLLLDPQWPSTRTQEDKIRAITTNTPQMRFFIHVDQASVESMLSGCTSRACAWKDCSAWFRLVATGLVSPSIEYVVGGEVVKDYEEEKKCRDALHRRFQVYNMSDVYATLAIDDRGWPRVFYEDDYEKGIAYI